MLPASSDSISSLIFLPLFFLFSDSSHLCLCIFPHCRKFDLRISFDKTNPLNLSNTLIENLRAFVEVSRSYR